MCLDVSYALFPSFLLAQSPLPSPGTSLVRVYLRVSFPQGFHLPSLQGFLESSTDTGPLTKGCSTQFSHPKPRTSQSVSVLKLVQKSSPQMHCPPPPWSISAAMAGYLVPLSPLCFPLDCPFHCRTSST